MDLFAFPVTDDTDIVKHEIPTAAFRIQFD